MNRLTQIIGIKSANYLLLNGRNWRKLLARSSVVRTSLLEQMMRKMKNGILGALMSVLAVQAGRYDDVADYRNLTPDNLLYPRKLAHVMR